MEWEELRRGSAVCQQELNLNTQEAARLDSILRDNYLPQNRVYRYNYFYDNCTTRARDRIEDAIEGNIKYSVIEKKMSFRDWIHQYTRNHPWSEFGIDICLGAEADMPINSRLQMYVPANLQLAFQNAQIVDAVGNTKPLLSAEREILVASSERSEKEFPFSPMQVSFAILIMTVLLCFVEWCFRRIFWGYDIFLFGIQGLAGCIIAFLFFFSVHPTVGSNYLIVFLNPIPLIYLPFMIYHIRKHKKDWYDIINIVILTLFIAFWGLIPQKISLVIVPLALSLLARSIIHMVVLYNPKNRERE